eukprot:SAG31_NODE_23501_length_503_cov_0.750000_2_plen_23_part_01
MYSSAQSYDKSAADYMYYQVRRR